MWQLIGSIVFMYAVVAGGYWLVTKRAEMRDQDASSTGKE